MYHSLFSSGSWGSTTGAAGGNVGGGTVGVVMVIEAKVGKGVCRGMVGGSGVTCCAVRERQKADTTTRKKIRNRISSRLRNGVDGPGEGDPVALFPPHEHNIHVS